MRPITLLRVTLTLNVVVTIAAMTLAYRALRHADDSGRLVVRSHRALQAAEETLRRAVDAETGTRGFMISRNPADLAPYDRALETIRRPMEDLATILREDTRQAGADRLRSQIDATLTILGRMVERTRGRRHRRLHARRGQCEHGRAPRNDQRDPSDRDRRAGRPDSDRRCGGQPREAAGHRHDRPCDGAAHLDRRPAGVHGAAGRVAWVKAI
jgi:CHASE3 domain-containing protein